MTTISLRATDTERKLIRDIAKLHGKTISQYIKDVVLDRIEDEYDLKAYDDALTEFKRNPVAYSLEEIKKRHGL
ncbi:type II toxin-antitoxin system RelB family antitoxin [Pelistega sp. MC2]|uniref:type II toxin-antitoxin system RelB family antitoxin n=1 Tax=Pelistega sp. MC2 TaxID=1720297 RepID=UPI0008DA5198|nr:DUF6290 family protein [Pelistega sp. MC2]